MSYLTFDKTLLINLERSLTKEMIRTNRAGAYNYTTLIDCNTRKYHGQLVLPLGGEPGSSLREDNYVLLGSLDETVIQHGAEFNLGIHKYNGNNYAPNGHKYIREFDCNIISRTTYRVGGVVLTKERMLVSFEPRVLIRYTLVEAHSATLLRFRPFLAYRSVNALTRQNDRANTGYEDVANGAVMQMYPEFPKLYMQFSRKCSYTHRPDWYKDIEYYKEQERGFEYQEDQYVPGYFELPLKKGESVIFSAGISEVNVRQLNSIWEKELERRNERTDMFACLKNSASQFYKREGKKCYLLAGYPWFKAEARSEFFSLPACTLMIDRPEYWQAIMDETAVDEIRAFLNKEYDKIKLADMDAPDALLWFIRAIQQYARFYSLEEAAKKYGNLCFDVIELYRKQGHPKALLHPNQLLFVEGRNMPATWMNSMEDGRPITPRTGYVVEINALWYNALKFVASLYRISGNEQRADLVDYQAEITRESFINTFWNGLYLDDYVIDDYHDKEVRPNQIWAASLPYSPLDRKKKKAVVDICTKELLTPRGLRTISPKSGNYRPQYIGGQKERDHNYHNGPVWPCTIAAYASAYMDVNKNSGVSFMQRMLVGYEAEMSELCIGTINELYDGNPPYKGHGGPSFAASVAAVISVLKTLQDFEKQDPEQNN